MKKCRKKKRIAIGILGVIMLFGLWGCAEQERPEVPAAENEMTEEEPENVPLLLKVATTQIPESKAYTGLEMFKQQVEAASGKSIEVQLYPSGQLGTQTVIMQGLQLGTLELAYLPLSAAENIYAPTAVLLGHFRGKSEDNILQTCESEETIMLLEKMRESKGIRCIGFSVGGQKNIWTRKKLEKAGDLQGLRIRVEETPMYLNMFQNLGASSLSMDLAQVYDGFSANLLDGIELDSLSVHDYRLYEACRFCLESGHAASVNTFFASEAVMENMSEEQQQIVQRAAEKVSDWLQTEYQREKTSLQHELEGKGVLFYRFEESAQQELSDVVDRSVKEYLKEY